MASDRGQNRYSDFVALETLLRFENCSSSHCLLSSWRRFHVFESSYPSFHRTVFFEALSVVFVASVPCLRVVVSLVSSYCFLRGIVCCLRGVGSMSSSRRIPRFIVLFSSRHCLLSSWRRFHVFESSYPSFHRNVFFVIFVFVSSALPFVDRDTYLTAVSRHLKKGRKKICPSLVCSFHHPAT